MNNELTEHEANISAGHVDNKVELKAGMLVKCKERPLASWFIPNRWYETFIHHLGGLSIREPLPAGGYWPIQNTQEDYKHFDLLNPRWPEQKKEEKPKPSTLWPDEIRLEMIEKSEFFKSAKVYQYGYYDGYQRALIEYGITEKKPQ